MHIKKREALSLSFVIGYRKNLSRCFFNSIILFYAHPEGCFSVRQTRTRPFDTNPLSLDIRPPPFNCYQIRNIKGIKTGCHAFFSTAIIISIHHSISNSYILTRPAAQSSEQAGANKSEFEQAKIQAVGVGPSKAVTESKMFFGPCC